MPDQERPEELTPRPAVHLWRWLGAALPFFFSVLPWFFSSTLPKVAQNAQVENSLRSSPIPELRAAPVAGVQVPNPHADLPPKRFKIQALEGRTLEARVFGSAQASKPDLLYGKRKLEGG